MGSEPPRKSSCRLVSSMSAINPAVYGNHCRKVIEATTLRFTSFARSFFSNRLSPDRIFQNLSLRWTAWEAEIGTRGRWFLKTVLLHDNGSESSDKSYTLPTRFLSRSSNLPLGRKGGGGTSVYQQALLKLNSSLFLSPGRLKVTDKIMKKRCLTGADWRAMIKKGQGLQMTVRRWKRRLFPALGKHKTKIINYFK